MFPNGAVNDSGQIVFGSGLQGPGVDATNDAAIWYDDGSGSLQLLLREGDPFTFDGHTRTVMTFQANFISSGAFGIDTFNDAGQFTTAISFTDGNH